MKTAKWYYKLPDEDDKPEGDSHDSDSTDTSHPGVPG